MGGGDHLAQALARHMGVDLGGGDVGVAEQGLDDPQVRAALGSMPASIAASASSWANRRGVSRPPLPPEGKSQGLAASPLGRVRALTSLQARTAARAASFRGASRSLPPLPRIIRKSGSRATAARVRLVSSDTRRPPA
jgi:hypothetical protein